MSKCTHIQKSPPFSGVYHFMSPQIVNCNRNGKRLLAKASEESYFSCSTICVRATWVSKRHQLFCRKASDRTRTIFLLLSMHDTTFSTSVTPTWQIIGIIYKIKEAPQPPIRYWGSYCIPNIRFIQKVFGVFINCCSDFLSILRLGCRMDILSQPPGLFGCNWYSGNCYSQWVIFVLCRWNILLNDEIEE